MKIHKAAFIGIFAIFSTLDQIKAQPDLGDTKSVMNFLAGEWNWVSTCGGIKFECTFADSADYTQALYFISLEGNSNDSMSYKLLKNGDLVGEGSVLVSYSNTIFGAERWTLEKLYELGYCKLVLNVHSEDTISLAENCADGYGFSFIRKSSGINLVKQKSKLIRIFINEYGNLVINSAGGNQLEGKLQFFSFNGKYLGAEDLTGTVLREVCPPRNGFLIYSFTDKTGAFQQGKVFVP